MKSIFLLLFLALLSATVAGQQRIRPDGTGGYVVESGDDFSMFGPKGSAVEQAQQWELRQQQIENQRLKNEILRKQLEQQQSGIRQPSPAPQVNPEWNKEFEAWKAANPWFGSDRAKTEFAMLYGTQLRQQRPDLTGRQILDAIAARVLEVFK